MREAPRDRRTRKPERAMLVAIKARNSPQQPNPEMQAGAEGERGSNQNSVVKEENQMKAVDYGQVTILRPNQNGLCLGARDGQPRRRFHNVESAISGSIENKAIAAIIASSRPLGVAGTLP